MNGENGVINTVKINHYYFVKLDDLPNRFLNLILAIRLVIEAEKFLINELKYTKESVRKYRRHWSTFLKSRSFSESGEVSYNVLNSFTLEHFENFNEKTLSTSDKDLIYSTLRLIEFKETGKLDTLKKIRNNSKGELFGEIGQYMREYLDYLENKKLIVKESIAQHHKYLLIFNVSCHEKGIQFSVDLDIDVIYYSIQQLDKRTSYCKPESLLRTIRGFYGFLVMKGVLNKKILNQIPKYKKIYRPKLPVIFKPDEIIDILKIPNRNTSTGKRNYALLLICLRYGLRANDIRNLKLSNINWDSNTIELKQNKTKVDITLPLYVDFGNALIDYLKNGRPDCKSDYIFLTTYYPYDPPLSASYITRMIRGYASKAGLNLRNRRTGVYSFRHTLASTLVNSSVPIHEISERLGHLKINSTKHYLKLDIETMRICCLPIPQVGGRFYQNFFTQFCS